MEGLWLGQGECSVFEDRPTMGDWGRQKEKEGGVLDYQVEKNLSSLDGLPGLRVARRAAGQRLWVGDGWARMRRVLAEKDGICFGFVLAAVLYLITTQLSALLRVGNMDMIWERVQWVTAR